MAQHRWLPPSTARRTPIHHAAYVRWKMSPQRQSPPRVAPCSYDAKVPSRRARWRKSGREPGAVEACDTTTDDQPCVIRLSSIRSGLASLEVVVSRNRPSAVRGAGACPPAIRPGARGQPLNGTLRAGREECSAAGVGACGECCWRAARPAHPRAQVLTGWPLLVSDISPMVAAWASATRRRRQRYRHHSRKCQMGGRQVGAWCKASSGKHTVVSQNSADESGPFVSLVGREA